MDVCTTLLETKLISQLWRDGFYEGASVSTSPRGFLLNIYVHSRPGGRRDIGFFFLPIVKIAPYEWSNLCIKQYSWINDDDRVTKGMKLKTEGYSSFCCVVVGKRYG